MICCRCQERWEMPWGILKIWTGATTARSGQGGRYKIHQKRKNGSFIQWSLNGAVDKKSWHLNGGLGRYWRQPRKQGSAKVPRISNPLPSLPKSSSYTATSQTLDSSQKSFSNTPMSQTINTLDSSDCNDVLPQSTLTYPKHHKRYLMNKLTVRQQFFVISIFNTTKTFLLRKLISQKD